MSIFHPARLKKILINLIFQLIINPWYVFNSNSKEVSQSSNHYIISLACTPHVTAWYWLYNVKYYAYKEKKLNQCRQRNSIFFRKKFFSILAMLQDFTLCQELTIRKVIFNFVMDVSLLRRESKCGCTTWDAIVCYETFLKQVRQNQRM